MIFHQPVLTNEVLELIKPEKNNKILDCTIGGGGHASLILNNFSDIYYYGVDQDLEALNYVKSTLQDNRLKLFHGNFSSINNIIPNTTFDRILIDLGVSSFQLDNSNRGFSYMKNGLLDMRMNQNDHNIPSAKDILNSYPEEKLADIFYQYGDEKKSRIIASEILKNRKIKEINYTEDLVKLIHNTIYGTYNNKQSSVKRVFQSLRIEVNKEIDILKPTLESLWSLLNNHGRLLVITFHSLEDRTIKNIFKYFIDNDDGLKLTKGAVSPKWEEIKKNSRAKSARIRGIKKYHE
jgi:16S rRNA (cytosine1402-N4)-methyltransferase